MNQLLAAVSRGSGGGCAEVRGADVIHLQVVCWRFWEVKEGAPHLPVAISWAKPAVGLARDAHEQPGQDSDQVYHLRLEHELNIERQQQSTGHHQLGQTASSEVKGRDDFWLTREMFEEIWCWIPTLGCV